MSSCPSVSAAVLALWRLAATMKVGNQIDGQVEGEAMKGKKSGKRGGRKKGY
jgi:hypothetical protein